MTEPNPGPPIEAPDAEAALTALRARGLRISATRRRMAEILYEARQPLTAEQVADRLGGAGRADLPSVYRNLEVLEEVGLVRHFHLGHGPGRYVPAGAGVHEYLVCERCQALLAVDPHELDDVRAQVQERFGFTARFTHFPIAGLCPDCTREVAG
jgi:Fur family ferric uptake transcriptional regulator